MKIVVLAGGLSTERDVSFATGSMVSEALKRKGHQVLLLDVFMGYGRKGDHLGDAFEKNGGVKLYVSGVPGTAPDIEKIKRMREDQSDCFFGPNVMELCQMADIVFLALHGENGEDGRLQAAFDLFGICYTGSGYLSSAIAMNKQLCKRFMADAGVPVPKGVSMKKSVPRPAFADTGMPLPCIVKPCCGGSSIGISIIHSPEEYGPALEEAFRWEEEIILEEYIVGREFSVAVIESEALPVIEIAPLAGFYDYINKYKAGNTVETCPADLPPEISQKIQEYALRVTEALSLHTYARVDFMLSRENQIYCLEANTLPGMTPTSLLPQEAQAVGMSFEDLCERLIEISVKKRKRNCKMQQ